MVEKQDITVASVIMAPKEKCRSEIEKLQQQNKEEKGLGFTECSPWRRSVLALRVPVSQTMQEFVCCLLFLFSCPSNLDIGSCWNGFSKSMKSELPISWFWWYFWPLLRSHLCSSIRHHILFKLPSKTRDQHDKGQCCSSYVSLMKGKKCLSQNPSSFPVRLINRPWVMCSPFSPGWHLPFLRWRDPFLIPTGRRELC